ncbi:MAG TPA: hypothetical protein VLE02_02705 [Nitrosarchaeum sp.]|nr:hypothetical protein [Nitrosarchaeum sp.]
MALELNEVLTIIGVTTVLTTASTTVIIYKFKSDLSSEICNKITHLHNRINEIAIRMGIIENEHKDC